MFAKNLLKIQSPKTATTIQNTTLPTDSMALTVVLDMSMYSSSTIFLGSVEARLMNPAMIEMA